VTGLFAISVSHPARAAERDGSERHILILLPADEQDHAMLLDGVRDGLGQAHAGGVTLHRQPLETTGPPQELRDRALANWLQERFRGRPIDGVVSVGATVSTFTARYADTLWPDVAILFAGVDDTWLAATARPVRSVAITLNHAYWQTARTALLLVPGAKRIVLVSDRSGGNDHPNREVHQQLASLSPHTELFDLTNCPVEELMWRVHALPSSDIILAIPGAAADISDDRATLSALAQRANRPMFVVEESLVGTGAVGGLVTSYANLGRRAGRQLQRLLDGEDPAQLRMTTAADTAWVFDQRQLQRWKLDTQNLPADSDVRFRDRAEFPTRVFWVCVLVAVLLVVGVAGAVMIGRSAHPRTMVPPPVPSEPELQRHLHDLAHMNMIAAMGEVAASVAHELNQPLTAMLSNAQAARRLLTSNTARATELREILDDIIEQDKRAGDVIQGMRRILKKDQFAWVPLDVSTLVNDVIHLLAHQAALHGVLLLTELTSGHPRVRGDRIQLQQVVLNLVLNGIEASRQSASARRRAVSIATRLEGATLRLSVCDSGGGIPPDATARLFEPFFTTKSEGLGMGLSISRSIVELHRGQIRARNLPGGGAEFSVCLPVEEGDAA
jgi:signal transduction histidine kinase